MSRQSSRADSTTPSSASLVDAVSVNAIAVLSRAINDKSFLT